MRIAFLSPFFPLRGGIAQFADAYFGELKQEHDVCAISYSRQYPGLLFPGKSQYVDNPKSREEVASFILDSVNPLTAHTTAKNINDFQPDILVVAYWMSFLAPILTRVVKRISPKTKIVALVHNYISHEARFYDALLAKRLFSKTHGAICLSQAVKDQLTSHDYQGKIKVLSHPHYNHYGEEIDRDIARGQLELKSDVPVILFFGLIRAYKGLDVLLDALQSYEKDIQLIIAGECYGDFSLYQNLIDKLPENVHILLTQKFISDEDVPLYFSAADLCVLPYRSATQSGVTAVAHHFHVPVLATKVGGIHEVVSDGKEGVLVEPNNPEAIREKIIEIFEHKKHEKMRDNLRETKVYAWSDFSADSLSFFQSI